MRRILSLVAGLLLLAACQDKSPQPGYIVQVSLGGWHSPDYTAEQVISRIGEVSAKIPVEKVIIGWSLDQDIYRQVGDYLHANGIKMLLWMPVFAETEEMCENEPAVDLAGDIPANYDLAAGEGFRFNCPTRPETAANVVAIYDDNFKDCGFDGVFLDRIRTQSFVSGVSGVLSCGCPVCRERFRARERGLEVGMDLYAPFMAQFVGQDYGILSQHADFIKPMLYRQTFAPAGMGFEYDLLRKAVPGAEGYPAFVMDVDFLDFQLKAMEPYACGKYPGIEINYREKVAPTSPEYVTESLAAVMRHGFDGAVLSWNVMEAPDSHISCLGAR